MLDGDGAAAAQGQDGEYRGQIHRTGQESVELQTRRVSFKGKLNEMSPWERV